MLQFLKIRFEFALFLVAALLLPSHAFCEDNTSVIAGFEQSKKTSIQKLVDNQIDSLLIDSKLYFVDFGTLKPVEAVPIDNHPMIFIADKYFVACITLLDNTGAEHPADIYVFEKNGEMRVSDIKFGNSGRNDLLRLMELGLVSEF